MSRTFLNLRERRTERGGCYSSGPWTPTTPPPPHQLWARGPWGGGREGVLGGVLVASTWPGCSVRTRLWTRLPHSCHRPLSDGHCSAASQFISRAPPTAFPAPPRPLGPVDSTGLGVHTGQGSLPPCAAGAGPTRPHWVGRPGVLRLKNPVGTGPVTGPGFWWGGGVWEGRLGGGGGAPGGVSRGVHALGSGLGLGIVLGSKMDKHFLRAPSASEGLLRPAPLTTNCWPEDP